MSDLELQARDLAEDKGISVEAAYAAVESLAIAERWPALRWDHVELERGPTWFGHYQLDAERELIDGIPWCAGCKRAVDRGWDHEEGCPLQELERTPHGTVKVTLVEATRYTRTRHGDGSLGILEQVAQRMGAHPEELRAQMRPDIGKPWSIGFALGQDEILHGNSYVSGTDRIDPLEVAVWVDQVDGGLWAATLSDPFARRRLVERADRTPAHEGARAWRLEPAELGEQSDTTAILGSLTAIDQLEERGIEASPFELADLLAYSLGYRKPPWWRRLLHPRRSRPYTHTVSAPAESTSPDEETS